MLENHITKLIKQSAGKSSFNWLSTYRHKLKQSFSKRDLFLAFSLCSRQFNNQPIVFENKLEHKFDSLDIKDWSLTHLVRVWLILHIPDQDQVEWVSVLNDLLDSADINEQICLYKSLPLFPHQSLLVNIVANGLRSNAKSIFEAIALDNPYCQQHFDEQRWNQMVLKALFIGSCIFSIIGIREKRNLSLAKMCFDFINERSKAGRDVAAEIWFLIAPYISDKELKMIRKNLEKPDKWTSLAVAIAIQESPINFHSIDLSLSEKSQSILETGAWGKNDINYWDRFITLYMNR